MPKVPTIRMCSNSRYKNLPNLTMISQEICTICSSELLRTSYASPANITALRNVLKNQYIFKSTSNRLVTEVDEVQHKYCKHREQQLEISYYYSPSHICSYYKQVLQKFTQFQLSLQLMSCLTSLSLQIVSFFSNSTDNFQ